MLTPPPAILGLHHVQISVPAAMVAAAIIFYRDVMGLVEIAKPDDLADRAAIWFQLGDQQLHLAIEDGINRRGTKVHLAYLVSDLQAWRDHMIANDVTPVASITIPGYDRFEARDPFGNRIEFIQRLP